MRGGGAAAVLRARPLRGGLALSPHLRRRLGALVVLAALLTCGYLFWLRDSGLVRVNRVAVTGLTAKDGERVRAALTSAARTMTTLHVRRDKLDRVVGPFPVVAGLAVKPEFPNGLRIRVVEHRPVAIAVSGGSRVPVAGDGTVLRGMPVEGSLPEVRSQGAIPAERLDDALARTEVRVAAAAPRALLRRLEDVHRSGGRGLVARLRGGPELIFGDLTGLEAKWAAAARVLADDGARGASYIDLRLTERPAAGGLPVETVAPVAPAGETTTGQAQTPQPAPGTAPEAPAGTPAGTGGASIVNPQP